MKRSWPLWIAFGLCLATALSAMAWISATILRLDRAEHDARKQTLIEENVRLALWRMDSTLSPLIAQETARPYFAYRAFTPAERAYTHMFQEIKYGEVLIPSPLLSNDLPFVLLHFQFGPDGITSPQAPGGNMRDLAVAQKYASRDRLVDMDRRLSQFSRMVPRNQLFLCVSVPPADPATQPVVALFNEALQQRQSDIALQQAAQMPAQQQQLEQRQQMVAPTKDRLQQRAEVEYQVRNLNTLNASNYEFVASRGNAKSISSGDRIREGVMQPYWLNGALILARRVALNDQDYVQGVWLDWPAIRQSLVESVADLLPNARLEPTDSQDISREPRRLASIPVRLITGDVPLPPPPPSPTRFTLQVAWVGVALASLAVAGLLFGAMRLSERRGAFVSAVTHELRTPLTTVSMYAEMLEEGMVRDNEQRQRYLGTLRAEANRLGHLVENVLAYSRIERGSAQSRISTLSAAELIDGVKKRLFDRAEQANFNLEIDLPPDLAPMRIRADPSAVEQILFNLVDNAGKYAQPANDRRLHLAAAADSKHLSLTLADHGPGISKTGLRKLFQPFSKSAHDAATSAPGVGLGLALSRRLAREMRGDLSYAGNGQGASFKLTLPRAD